MQNDFGNREFNVMRANRVDAHRRRPDASLIILISAVALVAVVLAFGATINVAWAQADLESRASTEQSYESETQGNRNLLVGAALSLTAIVLIGIGTKRRNAAARSITFAPKPGQESPQTAKSNVRPGRQDHA